MDKTNRFEVETDPIARVMYQRHLKGNKHATWYLLHTLEIGDNDDSHSVVGEW